MNCIPKTQLSKTCASHKWRKKGTVWIGLASLFAPVATIMAAVGDEVAFIVPKPPAIEKFCAFGVAFDGASLYVNRCEDYNMYRIDPVTGSVQATFLLGIEIPERPAGMAYDGDRYGLWVGTQKPAGIVMSDGCCEDGETAEECAAQNRSMPIYFLNLNNGSAQMQFSIPRNTTNPATGRPLFPGPKCIASGVAYVGNGIGTGDDEVWVTDDFSREIAVFRPTGELIRGYNAQSVNASLIQCSGLGIGNGMLYLSNRLQGDVFRTNRYSNPLAHVDQAFAETTGRWQVDMECDALTFPGKSVMWVRTSPQGIAANDRLTAYEIEPGGCGAQIPIGACCDSDTSSCRDVPQAACSGTWTQGTPCSQLDPPCFPVHRIILLDRTGSMMAVTSNGQTRCERALQTVKDELEVFFNTAPLGSSVAVWTFAATQPTALTAGFVGEAEASQALEALNPLGCQNLTPLAESICEAVDFVVGTFPSAPWPTLEISISSDGAENNSNGECFGPPSQSGTECNDADAVDPFDAGSWQEKVCTKIQSKAVFLAKYWGPPEILASAVETDLETGQLRGASVSDLTFFQALVQATGGSMIVIPLDDTVPSGPSSFGVQGACCLPTGQCQDDASQAECASLNGTHQGENTTCDNLPQPCVASIPAVSEWGMVALTLMVMVGGTIMLRRKKHSSVPQ
jgi:hypothetical protein